MSKIEYSYITNPLNGIKYSIYSVEGRSLINSYSDIVKEKFVGGGDGDCVGGFRVNCKDEKHEIQYGLDGLQLEGCLREIGSLGKENQYGNYWKSLADGVQPSNKRKVMCSTKSLGNKVWDRLFETIDTYCHRILNKEKGLTQHNRLQDKKVKPQKMDDDDRPIIEKDADEIDELSKEYKKMRKNIYKEAGLKDLFLSQDDEDELHSKKVFIIATHHTRIRKDLCPLEEPEFMGKKKGFGNTCCIQIKFNKQEITMAELHTALEFYKKKNYKKWIKKRKSQGIKVKDFVHNKDVLSLEPNIVSVSMVTPGTGGKEKYHYINSLNFSDLKLKTKDVITRNFARLYLEGHRNVELYIIRHGNATHNNPLNMRKFYFGKKIKIGIKDSPLTFLGMTQAALLGIDLHSIIFNNSSMNVYLTPISSPLLRAQNTAIIITAALSLRDKYPLIRNKKLYQAIAIFMTTGLDIKRKFKKVKKGGSLDEDGDRENEETEDEVTEEEDGGDDDDDDDDDDDKVYVPILPEKMINLLKFYTEISANIMRKNIDLDRCDLDNDYCNCLKIWPLRNKTQEPPTRFAITNECLCCSKFATKDEFMLNPTHRKLFRYIYRCVEVMNTDLTDENINDEEDLIKYLIKQIV